jgi:hypothetical protein
LQHCSKQARKQESKKEKKDLEERGRGTNQGLETGRRKEGRA